VRRLKLDSQLEIATRDLVMLTCTFVLIVSSCKKYCSILWCYNKNMIKSLHNLEFSSTKEITKFKYWIAFMWGTMLGADWWLKHCSCLSYYSTIVDEVWISHARGCGDGIMIEFGFGYKIIGICNYMISKYNPFRLCAEKCELWFLSFLIL